MSVISLKPEDPPNPNLLEQWCEQYRDRLIAMVRLRMSPRLATRMDPSDVVQEAMLEAAKRFTQQQQNPTLSPYLWLRLLTLQRLNIDYRRHLYTRKRSMGREVVMPRLEVSSVALAACLIDSGTSPSTSAVRHEQHAQLNDAIGTMSPFDREILTLRHFEYLDNEQCAGVLGISPTAARRRYYRALDRLREIMAPLLDSVEPD